MITIFPLKGDVGTALQDYVNTKQKKTIPNHEILMMSNTLKCKNFAILVGYLTGEVNLFNVNSGFVKTIAKYESAIISINLHNKGIIIGTAINGLHFFDKNNLSEKYELQLNNLDLKLKGLTLYFIDISLSKILLVTFEGDIIEISLKDSENISSERINTIIKLEGLINSFSILNEIDNNIILGGDNQCLSFINLISNEPSDYINIGKTISSIDSICMKESGFITAIGCTTGEVYTRVNWENEIVKYDIFGDKMITEVKFGMDDKMLVVCTQEKDIFICELIAETNKYSKIKSLKIQDGFPMSVNFDGDFNKMIILTSNWKFTVIDLNKFTVSGLGNEDLNNSFWVNFNGRYVISPKSMSVLSNTFLIGIKHNFVVCSDEMNNIHFWKDPVDVLRNSGYVIRIHGSHIQTMKITSNDEFLITAGLNDQMVCKWKIDHIINDRNALENLFFDNNNVDNDNNNVGKGIFSQKDFSENINISDVNLICELNYSFTQDVENISENNIKYSYDNGIAVRGFINANLNNIFSKPLSKFEKDTLILPTPTCLLLEYIYAPHVCERRNSVRYLHEFEMFEEDLTNKDYNAELIKRILNEHMEKKSINEIIKEINFSEPNKTVKNHKNCSRSFIYYTSRFVIIFYYEKNIQKIFQGHKNKVSCIAINSKNSIVASGEVSINPYMLIWKVSNLEILFSVKTGHMQGILNIEFTNNDKNLITIGFGLIFSLQIFNTFMKNTQIFINLGNYPIFFLKTFNSCGNKFITLGYKRITIWKIKGNLLNKIKQVESDENKEIDGKKSGKIFLCCDLLDYSLGNSIETDIIIGSNFGDITGISCNKFILLKANAHNGCINCIKSTTKLNEDNSNYTYYVITVGEDNLLKIWDQFYNNLRTIDIFKVKSIDYFNSTESYGINKGIQSLDVFSCKKGIVYFLLGIRSGDLIEISVLNPSNLVTKSSIELTENKNPDIAIKSTLPEINATFNHIYSYPYSYNLNFKFYRTKFTVHPLLPIVVIINIDQTLRLYDFFRKEYILIKNLGSSATCISFSPDGKLLAIGTIYGKVMIINVEIVVDKTDSRNLVYQVQKLEPIQFIQYEHRSINSNKNTNNYENRSYIPVILTKFSSHGDFLAISYGNKRGKDGKFQGGNMISVYMLRLSKKIQIVNKRGMSNDLYLKYIDITIPDNQYQIINMNKLETATTNIDFSEDDLFLLFTHQPISFLNNINNTNNINAINNGNKNNFIFLVWDLAKNQIIVNQEKLHSLNFPNFTNSSAIYTRNLTSLYSKNDINNNNNNDMENLDSVDKNNNNINSNISEASDKLNLTAIWQSPHSFSSIAGFTNGVLYVFRTSSLVFDSELINNFIIDKIPLDEMATSRSYAGHIGAIQSIEATSDERFIFTNSVIDQCVIQWFVMNEDSLWDLDFYPFDIHLPDPFNDVLNANVFNALKVSTWKNRIGLLDVYNEIFDEQTKISIDLIHIYGRRANDKRNNLKYDNNNRLIYSISSYIVFLTISNNGEMNQEFFVPVENFNNEYQMEISTFTLSNDKKEIAIAFNGLNAVVSRWEFSTQLPISKLTLDFCCIINNIKYSYNKMKIVGYGIHKDYYSFIFIIDVILNCLISCVTLLHTLPIKIKDIEFVNDSSEEFYTVGIQHLAFWNLRGGHLEYRNIPLKIISNINDNNINTNNNNENKTELSDENKYGCYLLVDERNKIDLITKSVYKENPDTYIKCTFINIATFDNNFSVLSADDGNLYTLENINITTKNKYHNSPIISLEKNVKMNFLVSGSMDGRVMLFKVDTNSKKLNINKIFRTIDENLDIPLKEILSSPENNVQSIGLGMNKIAVGTKSGDIIEFIITDEIDTINPNSFNLPNRKVNFQDHDPAISMTLDNNSNYFYSITGKGLLNVWNIKTFKNIYTYDYRINSKYLYHFKYQQKLLIVFENFLCVLDTSEEGKFKKLPIYDLQTGEINDVKISPNEKLLAVASLFDNTNPVLDIYDIVNGFIHKNQIQNLNTRIKFIDFSKESTFLLIEDYLEEVLVIDIQQKQVINNKGFFDLEWMGNGLKYSINLKNIHYIYEDNIKDCIISRHPSKNIIAIGDSLGCLRLFKYPAQENDRCFLCRTDHIGKITNIFFSFDNKYIITSSEFDKTAFMYKIKDQDAKFKDDENDDDDVNEASSNNDEKNSSQSKISSSASKNKSSVVENNNNGNNKNIQDESNNNISEKNNEEISKSNFSSTFQKNNQSSNNNSNTNKSNTNKSNTNKTNTNNSNTNKSNNENNTSIINSNNNNNNNNKNNNENENENENDEEENEEEEENKNQE